MSARAALAALLLSALCCAASASGAWASFGPIELQSVGPNDQFEGAGEPAISADGRYLAFAGTLDGVRGIYRKDLQTGQVQLVAGGSLFAPSPGTPTDATAPSISAEGRFVSFTTATPLVAAAHVGSNVYVRDMDIGPNGAACTGAMEASGVCAYELASALSTPGEPVEGLTYYAGAGAVASGRVALSADGRAVAFVIDGESNLTSEAGGSTPAVHTPPLQVAVRYLDRHETVLVSAEREASGAMTSLPVPGGAVQQDGSPAEGAALSADGSTVAWLGAHIPEQAPTLSDERSAIESDDEHATQDLAYDEPLWRRIGDGPLAPTRRIVGGGDPLAPGCPPEGTLALAACQGPFPGLAREERGGQESNLGWVTIRGYDDVPQLSADGWTVALLGDPPFSTSNVFVVNMHEGLSRKQAVRQLTQEVAVPFAFDPAPPDRPGAFVPTAGDVYDVAISPGGERIAFTTEREQFPLAPPYLVEPPLAVLGAAELYEADLADDVLERVTHGPHDGPSLGPSGASAPSYTSDGRTLAFASGAYNLVAGDANEAADAFTVTDREAVSTPGQVTIGSPDASHQRTTPQWKLSVVAVAHADGTATLDVVVPGAGRLAASATATVPVQVRIKARKARGRRASVTSAKRSSSVRTVLASRSVAHAQMSTALAGLLEVPLRVSSSYASLLTSSAGIYATVRVTFTGSGGPALKQTVVVSLHKRVRKRARRSKAKRRKAKR